MLNLVPLTGSWRIMTNRYVQPRLIRPMLQFHLPQPKAVAITATAISTNQHFLRLGIKGVTHFSPPTTNALHGKTRRVMGTAHGHPPLIAEPGSGTGPILLSQASFLLAHIANSGPVPLRPTAHRVPRDPVGEILIVRRDPRIAFRVVENQMSYAHLGDRLKSSAAENFPIFLADLCARADQAYLTPSTRALLERREQSEFMFPSSQAILDYATHRLLWSWYRRDSEAQGSS